MTDKRPDTSQPKAKWFTRLASGASNAAGRPATFGIAAGLLIAWAFLGPLFDWSDSWQLVVNTGTTIVTFLMVFLIQHTQNRDTVAMQIKLDELIRVTADARNKLIPLEDLEDTELERLRTELESMARRSGSGSARGGHSGPADRRSPERAD